MHKIKSIVYPVITGRDYAYASCPLFVERDSKAAAIDALRDEGYRIKRGGAHDVRSMTRDEVLAIRSANPDVQQTLHEIAHSMSDYDAITVHRVAVCPNI